MGLWKSFIGNNNTRMTPEGGLAIRMINDTGADSVKGTVVETSSTVLNGVELIPIDAPDPIGVMLEDGIPDGDLCWVVVSGKAKVFFVGDVDFDDFCRVTVAGDIGAENGKAIGEAVPVPPFATNKHFQEIGHALEARVGAGLALVNLHFN